MAKAKKNSLLLLTFLLSAVTALSGVMIGREISDRQKEKEDFSALAALVYRPPATEAEMTESPATAAPAKETTTRPESEPSTTAEESESEPSRRNLAPLYAQNMDFFGWLCISGTEIDYPVMHTPSDPQKYLRRNFDGKYSVSGVPFLDYRCSAESDNLIVYGHNMKNGTMFGTLKKFTDSKFLEAHPVIELETADECAYYEIFAVITVKKIDDWYSFIDAENEAEYTEWIELIRSKAILTADTVPAYGRRLLTLSTCHGSAGDGRLLVVAMAQE